MTPGVDLDVIMPKGDMGTLFSMNASEVNSEISKLILGQPGTTDGISSGLNSQQSIVMQGSRTRSRCATRMRWASATRRSCST
jgi:hypothetical protein